MIHFCCPFTVSKDYISKASWPIMVIGILTLCILMDFSTHVDTISMGLPIRYFKGSKVEFLSLKVVII